VVVRPTAPASEMKRKGKMSAENQGRTVKVKGKKMERSPNAAGGKQTYAGNTYTETYLF